MGEREYKGAWGIGELEGRRVWMGNCKRRMRHTCTGGAGLAVRLNNLFGDVRSGMGYESSPCPNVGELHLMSGRTVGMLLIALVCDFACMLEWLNSGYRFESVAIPHGRASTAAVNTMILV